MDFKDVGPALADVAKRYPIPHPSPELEALRDFLVRLLRRINDFLNSLFHHRGTPVDSQATSVLLQVLLSICAVLAVIWAIYAIMKRLMQSSRERSQLLKGAVEVTVPLDAAGWRHKADELARKQDFRGACRAAYLSLLQKFDEAGVAPFAPTKTNYEYVYSLTKQPQLKDKFKNFAELIDAIWFGNKTAREEEFKESCYLLSEMESLIQRQPGEVKTRW